VQLESRTTLTLTDFIVGEWIVAPSRNVLVSGEEEVRVEPRVMDLLVELAGRGHQSVSKEELIERIWKGRFVTDDVLTVTVYALRRALRDDARRPRYIETVSRRGYRLIAPVQPIMPPAPVLAAPPAVAAVADDVAETVGNRAESTGRRTSRPAAIAAIVSIAIVGGGALWLREATRPRRHVPSAEAHAAYQKGREFLDRRSIQGWKQALEHFERAIVLDAGYPGAHAGLADTYSAMSDFGVASPSEMRPRAVQSANRALQLDPESAEGEAALGRAQFLFDWDFDGAARRLERAVVLNPDYMPAYQSLAWLQSARGRHADAIAAARRALQLDPVNTARYTELAWVLSLDGRYDEALGEIDRALKLNPRSFETLIARGWTREMAGEPDAAFRAYREALRVGGAPDSMLQHVDDAYRSAGLPGYYRGWLDRPPSGNVPLSDTFRAQLYIRVGDLDHAIESLTRAYEKREGALAWVNVDPGYQPLRSDARFQRIAARVGHPN
jgi:DNA-binding winged helix-turn-helix (wHTH) protein/tetratricopeptide (TPR) repeat protein